MMKTVQDMRQKLARGIFLTALDSRFFRISKQTDPPFFSGASDTDVLAFPTIGYTIQASCCEGGTLQALEQLLTEVKLL
jgi:hypothetical protein